MKSDALGGLTILVVEDEPETLELVSLILRDSGADVRSAANAEAAMESLEAKTPHVMVSDLNLPDVHVAQPLSTDELLEAVRALGGPLSGSSPAR